MTEETKLFFVYNDNRQWVTTKVPLFAIRATWEQMEKFIECLESKRSMGQFGKHDRNTYLTFEAIPYYNSPDKVWEEVAKKRKAELESSAEYNALEQVLMF